MLALPIILIGILLCTITLAAQPPTAEPDSTPRDLRRDSIVLGPIVITATRLPTPAAQAPYAVSSVVQTSPAQGVSLGEVLRGVPGLQVDNRSNYAVGDRIALRGMGARSQFGVRGVRVFIDGIPATFADGQSALDAIDPQFIERAEVIRGAASMLYGNAAGGAILMSTKGARGSRVGVSFAGDGGPVTAYARAEYPLAGGSLRYLGSQVIYDGWREHSAASVARHVLGAQLPIGENDSLRLRVSYAALDADNPGSLSLESLENAPADANFSNVIQNTGKDLKQVELGAAYSKGSRDGVALDASVWGIVRNVDNPIIGRTILLDRIALGSRLSVSGGGAGDWLRWALGFDGDVQIDDRSNTVLLAHSDERVVVLDQWESVFAFGPFGIANVALMPELSMTAALRGDFVRFDVEDHLTDSLNPDDSGSRLMAALSPSLGLVWSPLESMTFFANVATGFETPTTTELANRPTGAGGFNPELEPQRSLSFELGYRTGTSAIPEELIGANRLELVAYQMFVDDGLIPFELDDAAGRVYYRNAGSATHRGFEASLSSNPLGIEGLQLELSWSIIDARFREFTVDSIRYDGNRIPGVARRQARIGVGYRTGGIVLGLDVLSQGPMVVDDANRAETATSKRLGLRAAYEGIQFEAAGAGMTLVPWVAVENVFDAAYAASVVPNAAGSRYYEPGRPRAFRGGIELRMGAR